MARRKFQPHQTKAWFEGCKQRTIELSQNGWRSCDIAEALGLSEATVSV